MIPILHAENETNFNHNGLGTLYGTIECLVTEERNGAFELELVYPADGALAKEITGFKFIMAKPNDIDDPHSFRIYEIEKNLEEGNITVYAATKTNDLGANLLEHVVVENVTAEEAMNAVQDNLIEPTNYMFISDIQTLNSGEWANQNPLSAIAGEEGSILSKWGGEIKRTNDTIYLYGRRGRDKVSVIRPGKNILGFNMVVSTKGMTTGLIPIATYTPRDTNVPYTIRGTQINSPLASNYPVHYLAMKDYSSYDIWPEEQTDSEGNPIPMSDAEFRAAALTNLNNAAASYFSVQNPGSDKPKITSTIDLLLLSDSDEYAKYKNLEHISLTDTVEVYVEQFGVDVEIKVHKLVYDSLKEQVRKIEAGSARYTMYSDVQKTYQEKVDKVKEYISTVENGIYNTIALTADEKNRIFRGYTTPDPSLVREEDLWFKPVANGEVEMYRYTNGAWVLAVTNADKIVIGTLDASAVNVVNINANNIATGSITGPNGKWDLDTGALYLGSSYTNSAFKWDGTTLTIRSESIVSTDGKTIDEKINDEIAAAPIYTWVKYADDDQGNGITDDPTGKAYLGIAPAQTTPTESNDPTAYIWSKTEGPQGIRGPSGADGYTPVKGTDYFDGKDGQDGTSTYLWVRYSQNADGSEMTSDPTDAIYIGTATTITATVPAYTLFNWSLIKGTNGLPGENGADGKTSYLHIKYSNDGGATFTANSGETVGDWIGTYVDFTAADSTSVSAYTWNKVKGEPGYTPVKGTDYFDGKDGQDGTSSYLWVRYSQNADGSEMTLDPTDAIYIGTATTTVNTAPSGYTSYKWSLVKGTNGLPGENGADGKTSYLHIKYSNDGGTTFTSNNGETVGEWIGTCVDFNSADPATVGAYTWNKVKGADGTTYYTWIKYADTPTTGMSNFPDGKEYMGIAYNKTTATESSTYADYTWSLIKGTDGIDGIDGEDGTPRYTWVKYADTETGSGMSDSPDGKRFLGLAHNKITATESSNAADYQWSPLYDNVQVGGRNLLPSSYLSGAETTKAVTYSLWAGTVVNTADVLKMLKTGEQYTLSYDMELVTRTGVPTLYSQAAGLNLYTPTQGTTIATTTASLIKLGDKARVVKTFICPALVDHRIICYTNRYTTNGGSPIGLDTIEFTNIKLEKGNIATDWTPAPEDIQAEMDALAGEIGDVSQALTDLDGYVDGSFKDGVISEAEAKAIEKYLNIVNTEKADVDAKYTKLYTNALLAGAAKTDLLAKKNLYNTAHTNLISAINSAISDGKANATEKANVDSKFTAYKTALTNLSTAFETASAYLVNAVNGRFDGPTGVMTRLTTVEDKVTPNAIISTVEERVSVDGSLVLATKSDITQTKDEWKATFSQVGGVNLIEIVKSTNGYYLSATGSAAVNASWAYTDYIEVVPGDKYFASGFSSLGTSPATCFYSSTKAFISGVAGSARETVMAPTNAKYMRFSFLIADKPNLMLEKEGGTRTSSTAINNEGVTVEDSIAPNKTTIFPSGMMVRNKETLKQLLTVEPDLTYIPELSADNIYSDTISRAVGNYSFQEINYYVAPTATGDGSGKDTSNKADNIQTALRNATNDGLILKNVNIIINVAPGKYNGLIRIMGYSGNGEIAILFGAGVYINGNIDIIDCSCRVRLNSGATGNFVLTKGTYLNPVTIINCSHAMLERPVIIHPLSTGYPIYIESSRVVVSSYDIAGSGGVSPARAVYADYNSQVYMMFGKGNTQNGPFNASRGSIITAYYGIPNPALSSAADCDTTTGTYFGKNTSRANSSATPPTIAWQTVTKTFKGRLYRVNNATGYRTDGSFIQGTSPNTGDFYKGYVSWGKEIYDYLQDNGGYQSLSSIKLITERGGYGYGNVSMKVASPAARTGTAQARYSTAETELVGYTLGTSVSTSQNLILSTTTTATTDYANFTKVLLKITVQKKV